MTKPYQISKHLVWEAYQRVKANKGAAGVDGESLQAFEAKLKDNLYKLWNRLSSGSYFPPPVKGVSIVIDINPAKQGKYLPATGLQVYSPVDVLPTLASGSTIWVMNSNYLQEIKNMSGNNFNYRCIDNESLNLSGKQLVESQQLRITMP